MKYEKAAAEKISFNGIEIFMGLSTNYDSLADLLNNECGNGYTPQGGGGNFTCASFGGVTNPKNGQELIFGDGQHRFVFDYHGNHWSLA